MAIQIPTIYQRQSTGKYFSNVSGVWRDIPDLPEEYKKSASTLDESALNNIYRGTSGGEMPWQQVIGRLQDEQGISAYGQSRLTQTVPAPAPAPVQNPNAFRPRNADENMTAYLQAKQAHEMQQTGTSTVSFGTPQVAQPQVAQPAVQAPVAQQPAQPVAPTSTNPNDYYKVATGKFGADGKPSYDIYDTKTGQKITAEQGTPLFQAGLNADHITEKPAPQSSIQPTTQPATQTPTTAQTSTPAQQPATGQSGASGGTPTTQPATPEATQMPFIQYQGSPDVFDRATGTYIPKEQADKIPDFFSKIEQMPGVRPGVQTPEDFAKVEKTNLQLQKNNVTVTPEDFQDNPLKAFQDTYQQIWNNLGLGSVKTQIETTLKAMKEVEFEMIDKIAEVSDNPWISEGARSREVSKLQSKYEQKNAANTGNLKLLQGLFESGQSEAHFVAQNAMEAFNKQQSFDQQVLLKRMDLAEKMATAMDKKTFRDLVGSDGRMHTYIVNEAGEKLADLGVSALPKPDGDGVSNITSDNERALLGQFQNSPIVKDYNNIIAQKNYIDRVITNGVGGPADLALVYSFMKGLDPNSVVRETEYATAAQSGNIFAGWAAKFNGYLKEEGGFLPKNVQEQFQNLVNQKLLAQQISYDNYAQSYREIAQRQGLNPDNVVPNFGGAIIQAAEGNQSPMSNEEFLQSMPTFGPPAPTQTDNQSFFGDIYNRLIGK